MSGKSRAVREAPSDEAAAGGRGPPRRLRDRIRALSAISMEQGINPETVDEAGNAAAACPARRGRLVACVQVSFFRGRPELGQLVQPPSSTRSTRTARSSTPSWGPFDEDKPDPRSILLSHGDAQRRERDRRGLHPTAGRRWRSPGPQRGEKASQEHRPQSTTTARRLAARRLSSAWCRRSWRQWWRRPLEVCFASRSTMGQPHQGHQRVSAASWPTEGASGRIQYREVWNNCLHDLNARRRLRHDAQVLTAASAGQGMRWHPDGRTGADRRRAGQACARWRQRLYPGSTTSSAGVAMGRS